MGFSGREREALRASLIKAAIESLSRAGFAKTSLDELTRQVGIAKGSFYSFFSSKEELYMEAFEGMEDEFRGAFYRAVEDAGFPPSEALRRGFESIFELLEKNPALGGIDQGLIQRLSLKLGPERIQAHQANDAKELEATYERWLAKGILRPIGVEALVGLVYSLFYLALHRGGMGAQEWAGARSLICESLALRIAPQGGES